MPEVLCLGENRSYRCVSNIFSCALRLLYRRVVTDYPAKIRRNDRSFELLLWRSLWVPFRINFKLRPSLDCAPLTGEKS